MICGFYHYLYSLKTTDDLSQTLLWLIRTSRIIIDFYCDYVAHIKTLTNIIKRSKQKRFQQIGKIKESCLVYWSWGTKRVGEHFWVLAAELPRRLPGCRILNKIHWKRHLTINHSIWNEYGIPRYFPAQKGMLREPWSRLWWTTLQQCLALRSWHFSGL